MTTRLEFLHIRGLRGLARVVRRHAKRLRRITRVIKSIEDAADKDFKAGNEDEVFQDWKKRFHEYHKLDDNEEDMIVDELEIEFEEEKDEKEEEDELNKLVKKLDDKKDLINPSIECIKEIKSKLFELFEYERVEAKDLLLVRSRITKYRSLYGDDWIGRSIKHMARKEKRELKQDNHDEDKFENQIHHIKKNVDKWTEDELKDECNNLNKFAQELKEESFHEIHDIHTLIHYVDILFMRLIEKSHEKIPQDLGDLKNAGIKDGFYNELGEDNKHLVEDLEKHAKHYYDLTRWLERHN